MPRRRRRRKKQLAETDLYGPIAEFLRRNGCTVRSEVLDCDITATKDDDLIIIELKRAFNTDLLIQAAKRQRITDSVYVAVPRPKGGLNTPKWRGIKHLLRRLEIGLIFVSFRKKKALVQVAFHPVPFDRRKQKSKRRAVLREIEARSGDYNTGGMTGSPIVTAYRENAIEIACLLERFGPLSPAELRKMGACSRTLSILYNDFYGWFERVDRGLYALRARAVADLEQFEEVLALYRKKAAAVSHPPAHKSATGA